MKRPRIALWIKWHGARVYPTLDGYLCRLWMPPWLWLWAVRRVDRWNDYRIMNDPVFVDLYKGFLESQQ